MQWLTINYVVQLKSMAVDKICNVFISNVLGDGSNHQIHFDGTSRCRFVLVLFSFFPRLCRSLAHSPLTLFLRFYSKNAAATLVLLLVMFLSFRHIVSICIFCSQCCGAFTLYFRVAVVVTFTFMHGDNLFDSFYSSRDSCSMLHS